MAQMLMENEVRWSFAFAVVALSVTPLHAKNATFTLVKVVQPADLDHILAAERGAFTYPGTGGPGYEMPTPSSAANAVEIYSVRYEAEIPELGGKTIVASGMVALPVLADRSALPLLSYQHGTVFGKYEVPSYAFQASNPSGSAHYEGAYETRYMAAMFAGNGYVVMAADYFGMGAGASLPEAYLMKASAQEANHELYKDVLVFLSSKGIAQTHLFLGGWSLGGLNTTGFLERLEASSVRVSGSFTAASPADPYAVLHGLLFHPRRGVDAPWTNTIIALTAFAAENYHGRPGLARAVINPKFYDDLKSVYDRSFGTEQDLFALLARWSNYPLLDFLRDEYRDPSYFRASEFGRLLAASETYRFAIQSPVQAYYGTHDEVIKEEVGRLPASYQGVLAGENADAIFNRVESRRVAGANHRLTFITAAHSARAWMDMLRKQTPPQQGRGDPSATAPAEPVDAQ